MASRDAKTDIQVIAKDILIEDDISIVAESASTIRITEEELYEPETFESLIQILNASLKEVEGDGEIDLTDSKHLLDVGGENFGLKFVLEAILRNKPNSDIFCNRIRQNLSKLTPGRRVYQPDQELDQAELYYLSKRWNMPLIIIKLGESLDTGHYTLALKRPEQTKDGQWRVLIADPTRPGERWHDLPDDWQTSNTSGSAVIMNDLVSQDYDYDLTFPGDLQTAANIELLESKSQRFQIDAYNCGLYCLLIAAVRMGLSSDKLSAFNVLGIRQIEEDTKIVEKGQLLPGVEILTRSQLGL